MSRPLIPRPPTGEIDDNPSPTAQRSKKISTACGACKQRKTRCSGSSPCDACAARGTSCLYDITSDQRRKIAAQRTLQDLSEVQVLLARFQQLLGGIIATFRAGDVEAQHVLLETIRSTVDLSQMAAHVRNARRADPSIEDAFSHIQFSLDSGEELPSPSHLLTASSNASPGFHNDDAKSLNAFYDPEMNFSTQE